MAASFGTAILAPFSISFKSLCVLEKIPAGTVGIAPKATNSPFCDSLKLFIYAVCCSTLTSISPSFNAISFCNKSENSTTSNLYPCFSKIGIIASSNKTVYGPAALP